MYLSKNSYYTTKFNYNMAGISIHHNGLDIFKERIDRNLPSASVNITNLIFDNQSVNYNFVLKPGLEILFIRKNSVADKAGLKVADKIISINKKKAVYYKLSEIIEIFQKSTDETVIIEVERN